MYTQVKRTLTAFIESGIDCMVVKGPALAHGVYPNPDLRTFKDLDLVVHEGDWSAVHELLVGVGFEPERDLPEPPPKLVPSAVLYEVRYWHRETGFLVELHFDDLLNAGLASRDVEGFWQRASWVDVEGVPVRTLCLEDQLVHLCVHAHFHGYTRLSWLSDIAFIVRDHAAHLDWNQVIHTVRTEEAQVGVYYSLHFLEKLLQVDVPGWILAALKPDRLRRWFHERYLPEERVLSLQPMGRPDFSFHHTPFLKRTLPDLLVMGRRMDKLHYLARLLGPPPDWLKAYYSLNGSTWIWVHYLLHPVKLTYHLVDELLHAVMARLA
jgi:hypothetical protein